MKINWDEVPDESGFSPIPDGEYLMRVAEIEEKTSSNGDPMWSLQLDVLDERYKGKRVYDNLTWSQSGLKRVKLVLRRLGLEVSGEQEVSTEDVKGRSAYVTVKGDSYFSEKHQKEMKRNKIPFDGYRKAEGGAATASTKEADADVPF